MAMCQIGQVRPFGDESLQSTRMIPVRSLCLITVSLRHRICQPKLQMLWSKTCSIVVSGPQIQFAETMQFSGGFRSHGGTPKSSKLLDHDLALKHMVTGGSPF